MSGFAFGLHYFIGGNKNGSGQFIEKLNAAGISVMMKGASDAGLCYEAQETGKKYSVENILIWRATSGREDRADYWLAPSAAAAKKWSEIRGLWPPELDPARVWWEVINEPRKEDAPDEVQPTWANMHTTAWLGLFLVEMAKLMNPAGYKLCGPSFSSGEPEPEDWQLEGMGSWLRYCAEHPKQAAVTSHEYNYGNVPFLDNYPWHYGRFQSIIAAADLLGIPRTFKIFLTEMGWQERNVPAFETAVPILAEYARLAAKFPQLAGLALWTLGAGWGDISNQLAAWISNQGDPLASWIINNQYPELPQPQATAAEFGATLPSEDDMEPKNCDLYLDLRRFVHLLPQDTTDDEIATITRQFNAAKNSFVYSHDDAELIVAHGRGQNPDGKKVSEVKIWEPERFADNVVDYFASRGHRYSIGHFDGPPPDPKPAQIDLKYRPCQTSVITQAFGANPQNYPLTPGHEGLDYGVVKDAPFYAAAAGLVVHASNLRWSTNEPSDYGWHVVLDHGDYCTVYAHARPDLPVLVGQPVTAGAVVGWSGNSGNSKGYHLHFSLLDKTGTIDPANGYPNWKYGRPVNPWPWVNGKPAPAGAVVTHDLLAYLRGPDKIQYDTDGKTFTQTYQYRHEGDAWRLVKGGNGQYEFLYADDQFIYRREDTSQGNDRFYVHYTAGKAGAPWLKRRMAVGETAVFFKDVVHYWNDCTVRIPKTAVTDSIRLNAIYSSYTFPGTGKTLANVAELEWLQGGERYWFAQGFGLVGFTDGPITAEFMGGPLQGRADLPIKQPGCLDLSGRFYG